MDSRIDRQRFGCGQNWAVRALVRNAGQEDFDRDGSGDAVDGDGVGNATDVCTATVLGSVVDRSTGCSLTQLCPCNAPRGQSVPWKNHGQYVSCVSQTTNNFLAQNLFTQAQKDAAQSSAAQSSCGK